MKSILVATAFAALAISSGVASANPATGGLTSLRNGDSVLVQQTGWRHHRRCWWSHGHRHCRWW